MEKFMSIINSYDPDKDSLVSYFLSKKKDFPKFSILSFEPKIINEALKHYPCKKIGTMFAGMNIPVYEVEYKNQKIALFLCIMGAPVTINFMELLHSHGVQSFLFMGSCGILEKSLASSSILVPTKAYRDEGTSYHYQIASDFIDIASSSKLINFLGEVCTPCITWTTDAIFRETKKKALERKALGCTVVDMEASAIAAAANFLNVKAYQFFWPLDNIFSKDNQFCKLSKTWEEYLNLALEISIFI